MSEQQNRRKELEEQRQRGLEAQLFLEYLEREPYFKNLFAEIDGELTASMLGLDPFKTEKFTLAQCKRLALYEPLTRVQQDIELGQRATAEMELLDSGRSNEKGIL